jgi:phytoene/squalene synthetase
MFNLKKFKIVEQYDFASEKEKLDQWMQELWYDRNNEHRREHPVLVTLLRTNGDSTVETPGPSFS